MYTCKFKLAKTPVKLPFKIFLHFSFWSGAFWYVSFIHCILVCSCVSIPTPYQSFEKEFKFIPVKKKYFLCADVVPLWLLTNCPFSAVFRLWELVLLFFSQVLLNIYLTNQVITSIYKPAVVAGSAVLCIMFIINASRSVSDYAKVCQDRSKSL